MQYWDKVGIYLDNRHKTDMVRNITLYGLKEGVHLQHKHSSTSRELWVRNPKTDEEGKVLESERDENGVLPPVVKGVRRAVGRAWRLDLLPKSLRLWQHDLPLEEAGKVPTG